MIPGCDVMLFYLNTVIPGCGVVLFQFNGYTIVDTVSDAAMKQFQIHKCDTMFLG